jgi:hypothetical protein
MPIQELSEQMPVLPTGTWYVGGGDEANASAAHGYVGGGGERGGTNACNARLKASSSNRHVSMRSTAYRGSDGECGNSNMRMPSLVASSSTSFCPATRSLTLTRRGGGPFKDERATQSCLV